ncbi:hypothetical protein LPJ60_002667 [Coemansia sp. RSA 2675]|nr:hypothetical protein LPJ60_002667 [Coemansia sp. RSA 2675]
MSWSLNRRQLLRPSLHRRPHTLAAEGPGGIDEGQAVLAAQSQAAAAALRRVQRELVASSAQAGEIQAVAAVASVLAGHAFADAVAVVLQEQRQVVVAVADVGRPCAMVVVGRRSFIESS